MAAWRSAVCGEMTAFIVSTITSYRHVSGILTGYTWIKISDMVRYE